MTVRLHIGNGAVLLRDFINIDLPGPHTFLAKDRPDLVKKWETTEDDYYGRHKDKSLNSLREGPLHQETVCDAYGSLDNIPAAYWSVSECLIVNVWEHLSIPEARKALDQIDGVMEPNGLLRIDVPNHIETLHRYRETGDPFYERHLLGPRNSERGFHLVGYTRDMLIALVEEHGFVYEGDDPREHLYPAISVKFRKPGPRAARDYAWPPPFKIPSDWKVAEVGPGDFPLERADVYIDRNIQKLTPLSEQGKSTILGNLEEGLSRIPNKSYDYLWCSHVLEHVYDPIACAATLSRIARRGTVVLPSVIKESIGGFEEADHKWMILPSPCECGPPVFVRQNPEYMKKARDVEVQKITSRLFRTGPNRHDEARYLRQWFYKNESSLDVVHHWDGELKLQVIG